jgi:flagellar hook protein FlgE
MNLYGSLAAGISGLNSQAASIAINEENISKINTEGYKQGTIDFSSLVTSVSHKTLDQQGLVPNTDNDSDVAISGSGFFVANTDENGETFYTRDGETFYTRAGLCWRRDADGNYVNAAGYTLMAWPFDNETKLPEYSENLDTLPNALLTSLRPVNSNSVTDSLNPDESVNIEDISYIGEPSTNNTEYGY